MAWMVFFIQAILFLWIFFHKLKIGLSGLKHFLYNVNDVLYMKKNIGEKLFS